MAKTKEEKRKEKRKEKQKERKAREAVFLQKDKIESLFQESLFYIQGKNWSKALGLLQKALHLKPNDQLLLERLGFVGYHMERPDIELKALLGLHENNLLKEDHILPLCELLYRHERCDEAIEIIDKTLPQIPKMKMRGKKKLTISMQQLKHSCLMHKQFLLNQEYLNKAKQTVEKKSVVNLPKEVEKVSEVKPDLTHKEFSIPEISVFIEMDVSTFKNALTGRTYLSYNDYELTLQANEIRFKETFDNLICLFGLKGVRSFWYQEETAKKVLKYFRGRALLADEVGLGKTVEALMVFKEYLQRGMVKSALILTPTPLVSQWKEEIKTKFDLDILSTDDPDYKTKGDEFWNTSFILASINLAKSKKNYEKVIQREYDMVIVDEAHHLKNKTTLNWKLINDLKKRYLLLLTATPVENNLIELYNLITLLKPGQLKTESAFKEEFMTRGDPTDPQNQEKLKELLGQVMIRNTRALAKIDIPPRFAQTIKVETTKNEKELYDRVTSFIIDISQKKGTANRLLLKNLLEEAGSSPKAVSLTLERMLIKRDFNLEQEQEIHAINNLCRTMNDTSKNKLLLKVIRSSPGKIIIFVKYIGTMDYISEFLSWENIPYALFHGQMSNAEKDRQINDFKDKKDVLLTTEIGGEGRNLQFCHQMINYDLPWNPMKIEQRIGRIHRIGQEKEVNIYNFCASGSAEDYILEILDKKINMFEMVIGEIDMIMGRIKGEQEFSDMIYDIWVNSSSDTERKESFDKLAVQLKRTKTSYEKTKILDEKLFGENYEL
ncbi:MAG: DEAD/DEAH box helicase [Desulfobacterales bacterium]|nr:DEAD/DEAH box helicase [Desulfobacterales bacterium]